MKESMLLLKEQFEEINKKGFIKSTRVGPTGIGKTFEDLLGKKEDNKSLPDFKGIEIKTKTSYSMRPTTLFTLTPRGNNNYEIKRLLNLYGYSDKKLCNAKVLNLVVCGNCYHCLGKNIFKLRVDKNQEKIFLSVYDMNFDLIEEQVYWSFRELRDRLYKKLEYLALISAKKKSINGENYYNYNRIDFYKLKNFEDFVKLIEMGVISVEFHIGVYKTGSKLGNIHDRGTNFHIKECDLTKLFNKIEV